MNRPNRIRMTGTAKACPDVGKEYDVREWKGDAPVIMYEDVGLITLEETSWEPVYEIEEITIPFKRRDHALHFTFADTSVEVTNDDEDPIGRIEALMGGGFKFVHYNEEGEREQYVVGPKDLWNAFSKHFGRTENIMD